MTDVIPIFAVIVVGSPSSGSVTFIREILETFDEKRLAHAVNLDPSDDVDFDYDLIDIRQKYSISDFIEEHGYKASMPFCLDEILKDEEWFETHILHLKGNFLLINLPGDLESLIHVEVIPRLNHYLDSFGSHSMVVNLIDSQLVLDSMALIGAYLNSLSLVSLYSMPFITVLTKSHLLREDEMRTLSELIQASEDQIIDKINEFTCGLLANMSVAFFELMKNYEIPRVMVFDSTEPETIHNIIGFMDATLKFINIASPDTDSDHNEQETINDEDLQLDPSIIPGLNQEELT